MLTVRMSEQEHRAPKLYAVLQGRSVNAVVLDLIRAELARQAPAAGGPSAEELAADVLARFGIDPGQPRPPRRRRPGPRQRAADQRRGRAGSGVTDPADPIVLDSSVLVACERMKTPGAFVLHETQSRIVEWLVQRVPLLVPALSLAIASHDCGGELPELDDRVLTENGDLLRVTRADHRPHPQLPATGPTTPPTTQQTARANPQSEGSPHADVLRHHTVPPAGHPEQGKRL